MWMQVWLFSHANGTRHMDLSEVFELRINAFHCMWFAGFYDGSSVTMCLIMCNQKSCVCNVSVVERGYPFLIPWAAFFSVRFHKNVLLQHCIIIVQMSCNYTSQQNLYMWVDLDTYFCCTSAHASFYFMMIFCKFCLAGNCPCILLVVHCFDWPLFCRTDWMLF